MGCFESDTVLALVDGRLLGDELAQAEDHLSTCETCADRVALAAGDQSHTQGMGRTPPPVTLPRGAAIGRYVTVDLVGRGGMGEVYVAYDPQLDRKVALKLLHQAASADSRARTRLLREAKAMARLSHPNVVVLHDAGEIDGRVFLAMEYVDGKTLAAWLNEKARDWQQIRDVFISAARGLAAAHEAGLVHRDFKPQNVMVGRDGSVRVTDFGLASDAAANDDDAAIEIDGTRAASAHTAGLTDTGILLGTPFYMAPEQFRGHRTDARTDQFSFCVSLYHALYGERPFGGGSVGALAEAVCAGRVRAPPQRSHVPTALRLAIFRGLQPRPDNRFPSMSALIHALEQDPKRRYRRLAVAVGVTGLIAMGMIGMRARPSLCKGGAAKIAGIWDPSTRTLARRSFVGTRKPYAADAFGSINRVIESYLDTWVGIYTEACEATHTRGEQSAEVLDLRMSCLQERLSGVKTLSEIFIKADGEVVGNAVSAASALPSLERCGDVKLLRSLMQPPDDPGIRARVDRVRQRIAEIKATRDAGRLKQAMNLAAALVVDAGRIDYSPVQAEAQAVQGELETVAGDPKTAEAILQRAFFTAEAARDDDLKAETSAYLIEAVGYHQGRYEDAERWIEQTQATLQRMGGHERLQVWVQNNIGMLYHVQGKYPEAVAAYQRARALAEAALPPDDPDVARPLANLAMALSAAGRPTEALSYNQRALDILRKAFGDGHPEVAMHVSNRGEILNALGRFDEARDLFRTALAVWARELPPDHPYFGDSLAGIGQSFLGQAAPARAIVPLQQALAIREKSGAEPLQVAETRFTLARALWDSGADRARAAALAVSAKAAFAARASAREKADEVARWREAHLSVRRAPASRPRRHALVTRQ